MMDDQKARDNVQIVFDRLIAAEAMLAALAETISPLIILGDHIGNTFPGGNGQPAFDRCEIIGRVKAAIAQAEAAGIKAGG